MRSLIILTLLTSYGREAAAQATSDSGSVTVRVFKADSLPLEGRVANAGVRIEIR